jgi:hypothetical protein
MAKVGSAPNLIHRSKCEREDCPRYEGSEQQVEELDKVEGNDA